MKKIYDEPALRETLILKGYQQKKIFTWQKTAALLYNSIMKCVH